MRLILLLVAAIGLGVPLSAQAPTTSSTDVGNPSRTQDADASVVVSLDRIRDGLKKSQDQSILRSIEVKPDFAVHIQEQAHIDEIMSKLHFEKTFVPAGGMYAYEQQRRLFNPTDRPLQQPYAAFSGGELITIAIENLIGRYLGSRVMNAVDSAGRTHDEAAARKEVDQSIADYCAQRPDRYEMQLCNAPALR